MAQLTQTNVTGNIHLFHLFLPLVQRGRAKKVVAISSGMADLDLVNRFEVEVGALYSASKAALNLIVAKFSAQYKREGILFLSISPGLVDVGKNKEGECDFLLSLGSVKWLHNWSITSDEVGIVQSRPSSRKSSGRGKSRKLRSKSRKRRCAVNS